MRVLHPVPSSTRSILILAIGFLLVAHLPECKGIDNDASHVRRNAATSSSTTTKNERRLQQPQPRVIGGTDAKAGAFPFFAYWDLHGCGATLIAGDMLLSAAHCYNPSEDDSFGTVYLGSIDYPGGTAYEVVEIFVHPEFNGDYESEPKYDFQLLRINETVPVAVATTVVLNQDANIPSVEDPWLTVIGFGSIDAEGWIYPEIMQQVDIPYIASQPTCAEFWPTTTILDAELCTLHPSPEGGLDSCYGDSGGPILTPDNVQVGVVSWGEGCGNVDAPAVAARVSYITKDWLQPQVCLHTKSDPPGYCQGLTADLPMSLRVEFANSNEAMNISWGLYQLVPPYATVYEIDHHELSSTISIVANSFYTPPVTTIATSRKKDDKRDDDDDDDDEGEGEGMVMQFANLPPGSYYFRVRQEQEAMSEMDTFDRVQVIQGNAADSWMEHAVVDLNGYLFGGFYQEFIDLQPTVTLSDVRSSTSDTNEALPLVVDIFYNDSPSETSWEVRNVVTDQVVVSATGNAAGLVTYRSQIPVLSLGQGQYEFRIWDQGGNGISAPITGDSGTSNIASRNNDIWVEIWLGYRQVWKFDGIFESEFWDVLDI